MVAPLVPDNDQEKEILKALDDTSGAYLMAYATGRGNLTGSGKPEGGNMVRLSMDKSVKTCKVPDCGRPTEGWRPECPGHRWRMKTHGDYGTTPIKDVPPNGTGPEGVIRFNGWDVVQRVDGLTPCWEYRGPKFANGYGQVKVKGTPQLAHRLVHRLWIGPTPQDLVVRHRCDNKPCINPEHLLLGTTQDNIRDREERGRTARGIRGVGKFTDDQIRDIRAEIATAQERIERGVIYRRIALRTGAHPGTIQKIWLRHTYAHVD